MERRDWEEKLDDLEFGLLDPAEAAKLREEIARDPELTRLDELVRSRHQSLQQAAKLSTTPIPLTIPTKASASTVKSTRWWRSPLAIAASILIALVAGEQSWYVRQTSITLAQKSVTLAVVTPQGQSSPVTAIVETSPILKPEEIGIRYGVAFDPGKGSYPPFEGLIKPSHDGLISFIPAGDFNGGQLTLGSGLWPPLRVNALDSLPVLSGVRSFISTDRGIYRPGETLYVRSVTLRQLPFTSGYLENGHFVVADSAGRRWFSGVADANVHGVSSHSWSIPADLPEGGYVVSIQPTKDSAATDRRPITIERFDTPRLRMKLELPRQSFRAGESLEGTILVEQPTGEPVANHELTARLVQNDVILTQKKSSTDVAGKGGIAVPIPEKLMPGLVEISVEVTVDGKTESTTHPVPILSREVDLAFFPESGPLVAGIENRVFFQARDVNDEPVRVKGHILDSAGQQVASFEASPTGRGSLTMTPKINERYSIELTGPAGLLPIRPFPEVSSEVAVLRPTQDVFDSWEGFQFDLPSTNVGQRVLLVATCRGSVVGLAAGVLGESVSMALIPSASGVIRVTLYDQIDEPRRPMAERLVFRRPRTQLAIEPNFSASKGKGLLSVVVKDQATNQPIDGALLGVSLVDQRFSDRDPMTRPTLASHFLILSAIRSPEDFETTDISLATSAEAERELDMVLATHGWRTFAPLEGDLPDEPKLVVTHSKSATDLASHREWIDQRHREHIRALWGISIAAALSFVVSSMLRKLGAPVSARLLAAVTMTFLVLASVPITFPTERNKSPEVWTRSKDEPDRTTMDDENGAAAGITMAPGKPSAVATREEMPASKVETNVPPAPVKAMRKQASNEPAQNEASGQTSTKGFAVELAPSAGAPVQDTARPVPAATAVPAKPVPVLFPQAPAMGRVFSPLRYRPTFGLDNKRPTIIWEPTAITQAKGKWVIGFDPPTEPGPYLLSVDVHTRDGSLGSIRQEVRLP